VKEIFKLLLAFAPWIAFLFIAGHSMLRLRIAIFVASALVVVMAVTKLHRGAVLWAGYVFFSFALIFVVWIQNSWVIHNLGILATGTLFTAAQLSILFGRPFTEDYAREHVPQEMWNSPQFIRGCYITTAAWSCVFLTNTLLNGVKTYYREIPEGYVSTLEYAIMIGGVAFTNIYSTVARKKRSAIQAKDSGE
jgi:magnesium-transporting ATPase (P-type)